MNHFTWVNNEYQQWIRALQGSTVHNFKEHPMVRRMLSLDMQADWFREIEKHSNKPWELLYDIHRIGWPNKQEPCGLDSLFRMVYYAEQLLHINPPSICEIGGGVGQFYAILRALGYKGDYYIYDLPEVKAFQNLYLAEVTKQTGLNTEQVKHHEFVASFYAYGEVSDRDKKTYWDNVIRDCKGGYIAWNPHSGASNSYSFITHNITATPGIEDGITIITW